MAAADKVTRVTENRACTMSPSRNISTKKLGGERKVVAISSPQVIGVARVAIKTIDVRKRAKAEGLKM